MRRLLTCFAVFVGAAIATDHAIAQSNARASNSAARTSASSPSLFSNSNARRGSTGGSAMGLSGGGGAGMNNRMSQNGQMQLGNGGSTSGSERYMRGNRQSSNFVGADLNEVSQFFSNLTGGRGGTGGANVSGPQSNNRGNDFNQQNQMQSNIVPHRLVVSFPYGFSANPRNPAVTAAASRMITLRALGRLPTQGPLSVELQDRTAILRGVVATDHDRALAEQLTLLEPGISQVQNELTVAEALPPTQPAAATE